MKKFVSDYDPENAPAILINKLGHTVRKMGNGGILFNSFKIANVTVTLPPVSYLVDTATSSDCSCN